VRTLRTISEPWNDIPPALLDRINLSLQPIVVELGPASAHSRFGGTRPLRPMVKFKGELTKQAKKFWGNAVLQVWNNQYTLMLITMTYASMLEAAPNTTKLDSNGGFPLNWMRNYNHWLRQVNDTIIKLDRYVIPSKENAKKE
jgi:hypothetical protein